MAIHFGGEEYGKVYVGGREFTRGRVAGNTILAPAPPATTDQPGTVTAAGVRNSRSRVSQLSAVLTDRDTITAVTAVRFQIVRTDLSVRFTHDLFTLVDNLGGMTMRILARSIPGNFRAGANNLVVCTVTYADTETRTAVSEPGSFTTR